MKSTEASEEFEGSGGEREVKESLEYKKWTEMYDVDKHVDVNGESETKGFCDFIIDTAGDRALRDPEPIWYSETPPTFKSYPTTTSTPNRTPQSQKSQKQRNQYPVFTPTYSSPSHTSYSTKTDEVFMTYDQASLAFGSGGVGKIREKNGEGRKIAVKGRPSRVKVGEINGFNEYGSINACNTSVTKIASKSGKKNGNRLKNSSKSASIRAREPKLYASDDEQIDEAIDQDDYYMNMRDDMTESELEEFLAGMASVDLNLSESDADSDNSYNSDSDSDAHSENSNSDDVSRLDSDEEFWQGDNFDSESSESYGLPKSKHPAQFGKQMKSKGPNAQQVKSVAKLSMQPKTPAQQLQQSKSTARKEKKQVKRDTRKENRATLQTNLANGQALTQKLYKSSTASKYDAQTLEILTRINKELHEFVVKSDKAELQLGPLPDVTRNLVKRLASMYSLKAKRSKGLVVYLTGSSWAPDSWRGFTEVLVNGGVKPLNTYAAPISSPHGKSKSAATNALAFPKVGHVVGHKAEPISVNNIGHRMLLKMGWKSGEGLGVAGSDGVREAIEVVVRGKLSGLGN